MSEAASRRDPPPPPLTREAALRHAARQLCREQGIDPDAWGPARAGDGAAFPLWHYQVPHATMCFEAARRASGLSEHEVDMLAAWMESDGTGPAVSEEMRRRGAALLRAAFVWPF